MKAILENKVPPAVPWKFIYGICMYKLCTWEWNSEHGLCVAIGEEAVKRQWLGDTLTKVTQVLTFCKAEKIEPSHRAPASLIHYVIQWGFCVGFFVSLSPLMLS